MTYLVLCGGVNLVLTAMNVDYTFYYMQWFIFACNMLAGDTVLRSFLMNMYRAKVAVDGEDSLEVCLGCPCNADNLLNSMKCVAGK